MKVIRIAEVEPVPIDTATPIPGWTGGEVRRTRQPLLPEGTSKNFSSSVVNFQRGATTGWHTHTSEQILVVAAGVGIVANEHEQHEITVGDVVHIQVGENHRRQSRVLNVPHHHNGSGLIKGHRSPLP